jgi:hypothetical protein
LGITAPKDIQVHREEVFAALTAANRQAATSASELEVLKGLSSEPVASSQAGPKQRPGTGPGTSGPRGGGPGSEPPASTDGGAGPQSAKGPSSGPPPRASTPSAPTGPPTSGSPTTSRSGGSPSAAAHPGRSK